MLDPMRFALNPDEPLLPPLGNLPPEIAALLSQAAATPRSYPHLDVKVSALGCRITTALTPHSGFYQDIDPITFERMIEEFRKAQASKNEGR